MTNQPVDAWQIDPRITDEDEIAAWTAAADAYQRHVPDGDPDALESAGHAAALGSTLRPGGLVARAVADELDRIANQTHLPLRPDLLRLAAEWREGKR